MARLLLAAAFVRTELTPVRASALKAAVSFSDSCTSFRFSLRCPRFDKRPGWDENFTGKVLSRLARLDPPVFDYTEGALDSIVSTQQLSSQLLCRGNGDRRRRTKLGRSVLESSCHAPQSYQNTQEKGGGLGYWPANALFVDAPIIPMR